MLFDNLKREKVSKREGHLCFFSSRLSKFSCTEDPFENVNESSASPILSLGIRNGAGSHAFQLLCRGEFIAARPTPPILQNIFALLQYTALLVTIHITEDSLQMTALLGDVFTVLCENSTLYGTIPYK
jgi:hypothetical protein